MTTGIQPGTGGAMRCPHCGAANEVWGSFCESCGKALPSATAAGPRVVGGMDYASTGVGQRIQSDELEKQAKKAAGALLAVAIVQTLFGLIIAFALEEMIAPGQKTLVLVVVFGIGAVFLGLYFWARVQPLPAAIVGLVLYVTMLLVDAVADPRSLARGWLIKAIIIAVLVNAIQAGVRHRNLKQQGATR